MVPRLRDVLFACALVVAAQPPAYAGSEVVGGPELVSAGIVVDQAAPALPAVSAAAWVVADVTSGEVLAARNAHGRFLPASTLKTLTAVALLPHLDPRSTYRVTAADVTVEGSRVGLVAGTEYTVNSLFESMLMVSGNDSANALASAVGGLSVARQLINAEARRLQANDTLASNPHGLDAPGQYTSAYDLALINRAGLAMPAYARYVRTLRSSMPLAGGRRFEIYNHNKLLRRYRGNIGVKTGYTVAARHSYVGAAYRNGHTILVTLLRAESSYPDATALLDWGFAAVGKVVPVGRLVDPLPEPGEDGDRAARSRDGADGADGADPPAAAPDQATAGPKPQRHATLVLPVAGVVVLVGITTMRRRAVRRRRLGGRSTLRLRLPVR